MYKGTKEYMGGFIMFNEHDFTVWGSFCECGQECSVLQNNEHPWNDTQFTIKMKCEQCGEEVIINKQKAEAFYNHKIFPYFKGVTGEVVDLGCGGGYLSRYCLENENVSKVYGMDIEGECRDHLIDLLNRFNHFFFINADLHDLDQLFDDTSIDYIISRDVFMFIEDTNKYFDDVTRLVKKGIRHMGWYVHDNPRMKNNLTPSEIAEEYKKRGWNVELESLDWYKSGYFIHAYKE
jgi:SAM-dependent methyltransferase